MRAGIRNLKYADLFSRMHCETTIADLHNKDSLAKAIKGAGTLFQLAAVYQHWALNVQKEIVVSNIAATRNVI